MNLLFGTKKCKWIPHFMDMLLSLEGIRGRCHGDNKAAPHKLNIVIINGMNMGRDDSLSRTGVNMEMREGTNASHCSALVL